MLLFAGPYNRFRALKIIIFAFCTAGPFPIIYAMIYSTGAGRKSLQQPFFCAFPSSLEASAERGEVSSLEEEPWKRGFRLP
jgi:hypothetical protein